MSDLVVEAAGLRKTVRTSSGRRTALDGLSLSVAAGGVHGLLGPPKSGRTTVLKMLVGLAVPDAGSIEVLGAAVPSALSTVITRIGAVVGGPRLFPDFTGRRNLHLLARSLGLTDVPVEAMLEFVGLTDQADQRVRRAPAGVRQRLAIAGALLNRPRLLILDEPTAGLDPAGAEHVHALIRAVAGHGTTVLVSTPDPMTVRAVCDSVSLIDRGRLLTVGWLDDVRRSPWGGWL